MDEQHPAAASAVVVGVDGSGTRPVVVGLANVSADAAAVTVAFADAQRRRFGTVVRRSSCPVMAVRGDARLVESDASQSAAPAQPQEPAPWTLHPRDRSELW
jgi:hypothetical protein